jgi:hypothetical protein
MHKPLAILMVFCLLAIPSLRGDEPVPPALAPASVQRLAPADRAFLEDLQRRSFDFFWHEANPANGFGRDRSGGDWCSVAGLGFGFSAICIGVDHGWITRQEGCRRILLTLETLAAAPQGEAPRGMAGNRGWFYHFLERDRPERVDWCEVSTVDTALFFAGAFDASIRFDNPQDPEECRLRQLADEMFRRIDWQWMTEGQPTLSLSWHPADGFSKCRWHGYNEGMIIYILALGTDRQPLSPDFWNAWTKNYQWKQREGFQYLQFAPLFGHQYSHCWIDFRNIADDYMRKKGITYFENSRRAVFAQQAYALRNPRKFPNYGLWEWGFTACNGPRRDGVDGYCARGAPPAELDDGTIAPTAVAGSIAFAPEICLPTLRQFRQRYPALWGKYGFTDAYNAKVNWIDDQYFAIDQGPIVLMIENYLTGATWRRTMSHPVIRRGLARAGFAAMAN